MIRYGADNRFVRFIALLIFLLMPAALYADTRISLISTIEKFYREQLNGPLGLFVDREQDEIYVADSGRKDILVFDTRGAPVARLGAVGDFSDPLDLVVRKGRIYLSREGSDHIEILNYRGEPIGRIAPAGVEFSPGRIDVDGDGSIYVVNKARTECLVFDDDDVLVKRIGQGLSSLTGVAVSPDRVYLITPFDDRAIQVYDKKGNFIRAFEGLEGRGGTLGLPSAAKVDALGRLWVVDALKGIVVYDTEGRELTRYIGDGSRRGRLFFPVDIDFDRQGMGYIAEKGGKRVSVFKITN